MLSGRIVTDWIGACSGGDRNSPQRLNSLSRQLYGSRRRGGTADFGIDCPGRAADDGSGRRSASRQRRPSESRQRDVKQVNAYGVLRPASADIMRASRITGERMPVIDATLYWWDATDEAEALFLVAVLNAPPRLKQAFARSRDSGRDLHLHPWRKVPMARFDAGNPDHRRLAGLAEEAEEQALTAVKELKESPANRRHSRFIRSRLANVGTLAEIDGIVRSLMPEQAAAP